MYKINTVSNLIQGAAEETETFSKTIVYKVITLD